MKAWAISLLLYLLALYAIISTGENAHPVAEADNPAVGL
jgi:hypothetical protein